MTGLEYEKVVAQYLRQHGYKRVSVTQGSGDFGIDVIAYKHGHKYAVQCKYYTSAVSLSAVQEAVTGMAYYGCDRAMVVTNNTFTQAAKELAACNNVTLLENIKSAGFMIKWQHLLRVIVALYAFVMLAALSAAFYTVFANPSFSNVFQFVLLLLIVFSPLWVYLIVKALLYHFRNKKPVNSDTIVPEVVKITEYADARKIHKLIQNEESIITLSQVVQLVNSETVTTSKIQRIFKFGYARAGRIIDLLNENGYVVQDKEFIYKWTEKAK
ncbi:MAG: restriction endonuclease [Clostridia bacterium]|nr:restriction endonuclease [Clostridia bacterium]